MAVALVSGWFLLPKEGHRRFAVLLLCGIIGFAGANQGMKAALHPARPACGSCSACRWRRSPGYVRQQEELTETEKEEILSFIPDAQRYQPHLADGVKRHTAVGASTLPQFLKLYGRLLRQYPADLADAWAYLTTASLAPLTIPPIWHLRERHYTATWRPLPSPDTA